MAHPVFVDFGYMVDKVGRQALLQTSRICVRHGRRLRVACKMAVCSDLQTQRRLRIIVLRCVYSVYVSNMHKLKGSNDFMIAGSKDMKLHHASTPEVGVGDGFVALSKMRSGICAMVTGIDADDDDLRRLKAMGVCPGRRVELIQPGDPLILRVLGSRIGLSARLADRIRVDICHNDACNKTVAQAG